MIDVFFFFASFLTDILKEAKLWISNIFMSLLLRKQKQDTWSGNLNTKYIGLWSVQ
jgi:hypothetical protein